MHHYMLSCNLYCFWSVFDLLSCNFVNSYMAVAYSVIAFEALAPALAPAAASAEAITRQEDILIRHQLGVAAQHA